MAEIRVENLQKSFGDFVAVKEFKLHHTDGAFFCLLGPSGCGKTTTLRMIAGLELPTSGRIFLGGEDVAFKRASERDIAFVFQLFALYPHMNVRRNIGFSLLCQGVAAGGDQSPRVEETAKLLRIEHICSTSRSPASPAATASAWRWAAPSCAGRCAFLMDEPLGTLDTEFRDLMCERTARPARPHQGDHGLCHP